MQLINNPCSNKHVALIVLVRSIILHEQSGDLLPNVWVEFLHWPALGKLYQKPILFVLSHCPPLSPVKYIESTFSCSLYYTLKIQIWLLNHTKRW